MLGIADFFIHNSIQRFYRSTSGVMALEMVVVLVPFIFLFLFIAELCFVVYLSASIDLAMSESMRYASANMTSSEYRGIFLRKMQENVRFLPLLKDDDKLTVEVTYCASIAEATAKTCSNVSAKKPIAMYEIHYHYDPIFLPLPQKILEDGLNRMSVYVQEKERRG